MILRETQVTLGQTDEWTPILRWQGLTLRSLAYQVTVSGPGTVRFRRTGIGLRPYKRGTISGSAVFRITPVDLILGVDVMATSPDTRVTITPVKG